MNELFLLGLVFLIGRILFGGFFIRSGVNHFRNKAGMAAYAASRGVPVPELAVITTGTLLILGGAGIVLGAYVKWALIALVLFLVPTTFMMHNYWTETNPMERMNSEINFYKNIALLGAVLMMFVMADIVWVYSLRAWFNLG